MSRKKIVIKMPSADQADAGEPSPEAMAGSHAEALGGAFGPSGDAETDRWIRAEDVVPLPDNSSARSAPPTLGLLRCPATGLDNRSRRGPNVHAGSRVEFLPSLGARLVLGGERGQAVSPVVRRPTLTPNPRFSERPVRSAARSISIARSRQLVSLRAQRRIQGPHHAAPGLLRARAPRNDGRGISVQSIR